MKKLVLMVVAVLLLTVALSGEVFADIHYDESKGGYYSDSEDDGTISINCDVFSSDGSVCGLKDGRKYFRNVVAVPAEHLRESVELQALLAGGKEEALSSIEALKIMKHEGKQYFVIPSKSELAASDILIDFVNKATGETAARAYNIEKDVLYIILTEAEVAPTDARLAVNQMSVSGERSPSFIIPHEHYYYTTDRPVPINFNGYQNEFMVQHFMKDNAELNVRFLRGHGGMNTVNMILYASDKFTHISYYMGNMRPGDAVYTSTVKIGDSIWVVMSTNSNISDLADLRVTESRVPRPNLPWSLESEE